jgi:hypothetical protein
MNGIGAHTGQTYIQTFIFIYIDLATIFSSFKLFISNQNYIRFYKLICCDSVRREKVYPKISPH